MTASISRVLFTERERFTNRMLAMGLPPSHLRESCYHIACTFEPKSQKTFNHLTHALTYLFLTLPRFHQHLSFPKLFPSFDSIPSCRKKYSGSETDTLTLTKNAEACPYTLWDRSTFFASNSDTLQVIYITIAFLSSVSTSYMSEWPAVILPNTNVSTRRREHLGTLPYPGHLQYWWRKNPEKFQHQIRHLRIRELSSYRSCSCVLLMVRTAVSNMMQLYYRRESSTSRPETPIPALKIRTTMIRTTIVRLTTSSPSSVRLDRP